MVRRLVCWLRRDLRLNDNRALAEATGSAAEVAVVFVLDRDLLAALPDRDDLRVSFLFSALNELDERLRRLGSRLVVAYGDPCEEIPRLVNALRAQGVVFARDSEPAVRERDATLTGLLEAGGACVRTVKDVVVLEPDEVRTKAGGPYMVFGPYARTWRARLRSSDLAEAVPEPGSLMREASLRELLGAAWRWEWSLADVGFRAVPLWLPTGESGAAALLGEFRCRLKEYHSQRDFPFLDSTSHLSAHLRFGTVSIRQCARVALEEHGPGHASWLNELVWREFFHGILWDFPHVVHGCFRKQYDQIEWPGSQDLFAAWCAGETGYPIVDAAMRMLNRTGWMHNRLRMIVASFLVKDLLCDWRWGEAYFARKLLDFEMASNNGGWQWAASTGCDAQPHFRIFNPVMQGRRFDPAGDFVVSQIPELAGLPPRHRQAPWEAQPSVLLRAGIHLGKEYPRPMVNHEAQRLAAMALFRQ